MSEVQEVVIFQLFGELLVDCLLGNLSWNWQQGDGSVDLRFCWVGGWFLQEGSHFSVFPVLREGGRGDRGAQDSLLPIVLLLRLKMWWGQGSVGAPECLEFMMEIVA